MVIGPAPDSLRSNAAGRFLFGRLRWPIGWVRTPRSADDPLPLFAVGCRWSTFARPPVHYADWAYTFG